MIWQTISCLLASAGLLLFLWCLTGSFLLPVRGFTLVLRVSGDAPGLEQSVRGAAWLIGTGFLPARVQLVDCGLTEEARQRAERLARRRAYLEIVQEDGFERGSGAGPRQRGRGDLPE